MRKNPQDNRGKSYFNTNSILSAGFVVERTRGKWVSEPQKHFSSLVTSWPYITHHDVNELGEAEGTACVWLAKESLCQSTILPGNHTLDSFFKVEIFHQEVLHKDTEPKA